MVYHCDGIFSVLLLSRDLKNICIYPLYFSGPVSY